MIKIILATNIVLRLKIFQSDKHSILRQKQRCKELRVKNILEKTYSMAQEKVTYQKDFAVED